MTTTWKQYKDYEFTPFEKQVRAFLLKDERTSGALGEATGIHASSLRQFRQGKRRLSIENLSRLAKALGVKVEVTQRQAPAPAAA